MKNQKKVWIITVLFFAAGLLQILSHDFSSDGDDSLGLIAGGLFIIAGLTYLIQYFRSQAKA